MRKLLCIIFVFLLSISFAAIPANSQIITGTWKRSIIHNNAGLKVTLADQNPILFGNLPTPGTMITEVVQLTDGRSGSGSHTLPIPVYSDGSPADPSEILWTVMVELEASTGATVAAITATVAYSGGNMFSLGTEAMQSPAIGACRAFAGAYVPMNLLTVCVRITAVAIRTSAPVATQESTWGEVKDKYSD